MQNLHTIAGLGVRIQGHLKILEYADHAAYLAGEPSRVLLDKRNAVHKENAVNLVVKAITGRSNNSIAQMVFGNGGTLLDQTGTITFNSPNVVGTSTDLYHPVFFQMVDDTLGAIPGNQMSIRHIHGTVFSDMDIRCLIDASQPFGQLPSDQFQPLTFKHTDAGDSPVATTQFVFDEIGLKLQDGTLLTHVVFVPIIKTASSLIEVVYTIRLAVGEPPPEPLDAIVFLTGVQAIAQFNEPTVSLGFHGVRLNNSPFFEHMPAAIANNSRGSLSVWVNSSDIFTMAHDLGPAFISSAQRTALEISGRGYSRRQPTAITRTNPVQITLPSHGLTGDETIEFNAITGGCSELMSIDPDDNTVTIVDANNFTIPVDGTGFAAAYTGPAQLTIRTADLPVPNTLRLVLRDTDNPANVGSANEFYWNSAASEQIPSNQWVNLLISWDMNHPSGQKVLQVYYNDTPLASASDATYRYDPDAAFDVDYTATPQWFVGKPVIVQNFVSTPQIVREVLRSRN